MFFGRHHKVFCRKNQKREESGGTAARRNPWRALGLCTREQKKECRWPDSNRHGFHHRHLKPACLPIHHIGKNRNSLLRGWELPLLPQVERKNALAMLTYLSMLRLLSHFFVQPGQSLDLRSSSYTSGLLPKIELFIGLEQKD